MEINQYDILKEEGKKIQNEKRTEKKLIERKQLNQTFCFDNIEGS